jgi:hypothetical protein
LHILCRWHTLPLDRVSLVSSYKMKVDHATGRQVACADAVIVAALSRCSSWGLLPHGLEPLCCRDGTEVPCSRCTRWTRSHSPLAAF